MRRTRWQLSTVLTALVLGVSCGGGATGSEQALCEDARAHSEVFTAEGFRTADPEVVGVLRDLADEAPASVRDDVEEVLEASSDAELHQALSEIERYLTEECGIDVIE